MPLSSLRRLLPQLVVMAALLFTLASCGDNEDDDPTPTTAAQSAPTAAPSTSPPTGGDVSDTGGCWTNGHRLADLEGKPQWSQAPAMVIDAAKTYTATIETSKGTITIELLAKDAPTTVNSFVCLARAGYFDGIKFHRIVPEFVIQTGDPTGTGREGPGYSFQDELPTTLNYERGTLAMANAGPNTNGSQFFICLADLSQRLQKNYSIFGKVTAGMEVVDAIAAVPVQVGPSGEPSSPTEQVLMTKVTISEA